MIGKNEKIHGQFGIQSIINNQYSKSIFGSSTALNVATYIPAINCEITKPKEDFFLIKLSPSSEGYSTLDVHLGFCFLEVKKCFWKRQRKM